MDLLALMLIASSMLTIVGLILASVVFAPWFVVFGALGLLAFLPRLTDDESAMAVRSTASVSSVSRGSAQPQKNSYAQAAQHSSSTTNRALEPKLPTLNYRGGSYSSSAIAVREPVASDTASTD